MAFDLNIFGKKYFAVLFYEWVNPFKKENFRSKIFQDIDYKQ